MPRDLARPRSRLDHSVRWVARNLGGQTAGRSPVAARYAGTAVKTLTLVPIALCGLLIGPHSPLLALAAIIATYFGTTLGFRVLRKRQRAD